jgi:YVTN family beta-propeller protein
MRKSQGGWIRSGALGVALFAIVGCANEPDVGASTQALANRAYIVSLESDELTVLDLSKLEIVGRVSTNGVANHMAEVNADFTKVYVDSSHTNETIVVDAKTLEVITRIPTGAHPTHLSLSRDGKLLAVMAEAEGLGAISFIDPERDVEIKRLDGFYTPHFMRFSPDGRYGYVANINAHHLTRVDLTSLEIESHIALDGFSGPPDATPAPGEGGFADAQIDASGVLYAAHRASGRVLVYDTVAAHKLPELAVGRGPWIVFAEHPFAELPLRHVVPNFGDRTLSLIDGGGPATVIGTLPGDEEAYGVNFSPRSPGKAFVMNRVRQDVAVVDIVDGEIVGRIPVGGNTETAATTADGKWIVAAVSGADRVVVIDAVTSEIVKTFDDVGRYPWSVTIPGGQNYCH